MKNSFVIAAFLGLVSVGQAYREGQYIVRQTPYGSVLLEDHQESGWTEDDDYELVQRRASA